MERVDSEDKSLGESSLGDGSESEFDQENEDNPEDPNFDRHDSIMQQFNVTIQWRESWNHDFYLLNLAETRDHILRSGSMSRLTLIMDDSFVSRYMALDPDSRRKVSDALQGTSMITEIWVHEMSSFLSAASTDGLRFSLFHLWICEPLLAHLDTVTKVRIDVARDTAGVMKLVVRNLRSMEELTLRGYTDEQSIREVMVEQVELYNINGFHGNEEEEDNSNDVQASNALKALTSAQSIARMLDLDLPSLDIHVIGQSFQSVEAQEALGVGISNARVHGLSLTDVSLGGDGALFAQSFNGSLLQCLKVSELNFKLGSATYFLSGLASVLPNMPQLEELCSYEFNEILHNQPGIQHSVADLAFASTQCPKLRILTLCIGQCTELMENALSQCLGADSSLTELTIRIYGDPDDENDDDDDEEEPVYIMPALEEAVKTNYTIRVIEFESISCRCDRDSKLRINIMLRLNQAGRKYLATDANDKEAAVRVLGKVKDSQDCLFYHLRENPSICGRALVAATNEASPTQLASRKRLASED